MLGTKEAVFNGLADNTVIDINLNFCTLTTKDINNLCEQLRGGCSQESLSLSYTGIGDSEVALLCDILANNLTITSLDLTGNKLTEEAGKMLAKLLENNHAITFLEVGSESFSPETCAAITKGLNNNNALKEAYLKAVTHTPSEVKDYLEKRVSIYACDAQGNTGLHLAVIKKELKLVSLFLYKNKKLNLHLLEKKNKDGKLASELVEGSNSILGLFNSDLTRPEPKTTPPSPSSKVSVSRPLDSPNSKHLKPEYKCPISQCIMFEPYSVSGGHTYEKECIERHIEILQKEGRPLTNPLTNMPISEAITLGAVDN